MASYITPNFEKYPSDKMPDDVTFIYMHEDAYKFMLEVFGDYQKEALNERIQSFISMLNTATGHDILLSDYIAMLEKEIKMAKFSKFIIVENTVMNNPQVKEFDADWYSNSREEAHHA